MYRIVIVLLIVISTGCASIAPPLSTAVANKLTHGRTAIAFYDSNKRINYIEDVYLVLAVAQNASSSSYNGVWESSKEITEIHKQELDKLGLKAISVYDIFSKSEINKLNSLNNKLTQYSDAEPQLLTPEITKFLLEENIDHLFLIDWSGYTLHIQTLGLPAVAYTDMNFRLYDTMKGNIIWHGQFRSVTKPKLRSKSGKDYLEKRNMAGFKSEVRKMILTRYDSDVDDNLGKVIGIGRGN